MARVSSGEPGATAYRAAKTSPRAPSRNTAILTRRDIGAGRSHRQCIQPRHTHDGQPRRERKPLDGREADAQPGERTRSESHGEERHVAERQAARLERGERVAGQTHAMRPRSVAGSRVHDNAIAAHRHAAVRRRSVQRKRRHDL